MELEEAIKEMKSLSPSEDAIKIILYELESYKERYKIAIEQNVKDYKNSIPKKKIEELKNKFKKPNNKNTYYFKYDFIQKEFDKLLEDE